MINFEELEKYRENNRIEAKKSVGGLPKSIWETYSAFANTMGGIILLGVEEAKDHSLHALDLPDPDRLIREFWNIVNNPQKASVNILSDRHVQKHIIDEKTVISIEIPRAQRSDRPVYIDGNPLSGSYRRNGEGDYRCSKEEVQSMLRDAAVRTQDMKVMEDMPLDVLDKDSVRRYRLRMKNFRPGHVWEELDDDAFLYKIGAVARDKENLFHPTAAGLLMFGFEYEIVKEYPAYFLDYQENMDPSTRWTDRIVSSSGDWSGNLYDFYFRVYNKITQDIKTPFRLEGGDRIDDTPVHQALREALANALINSDYYGHGGVVVKKSSDEITITNPGNFRIDVEDAKSGGISDPRNAALIKMFNLINIGERAGSGVPNIYMVWDRLGFPAPEIREYFNPERITLTLKLSADKKPPIKIADKLEAITEYLTDNPSAKASELSDLLGISARRTREILKKLIDDGIVSVEGGNRNRVYRLRR